MSDSISTADQAQPEYLGEKCGEKCGDRRDVPRFPHATGRQFGERRDISSYFPGYDIKGELIQVTDPLNHGHVPARCPGLGADGIWRLCSREEATHQLFSTAFHKKNPNGN